MRCLLGHTSYLLWLFFSPLWSSLSKLWCISDDFDPFSLRSLVASVTFIYIFNVYTLFLFIYIHSLMPWIAWVIMLSTMPLHCPWKHIHNRQSFHSDLWSGKHYHYTYSICSFFRMSPFPFHSALVHKHPAVLNTAFTIAPDARPLQSWPFFLAPETSHKNLIFLVGLFGLLNVHTCI